MIINLLPLEKKQEIKQEKSWKIILALILSFMFAIICFYLILSLINIFLSEKINFQEIIYHENQDKFSYFNIKDFKNDLEKLDKTIFNLNDFYEKQFKVNQALKKISETIPDEIFITNLLINLNEKQGIIECVLTGFALNRDVLFHFKQNLEKNENFEDIVLPTSSWLTQSDINFTLNFKIKWQ